MAIVIPSTTKHHSFRTDTTHVASLPPGLTRKTVEAISSMKGEPDWMRAERLRALEIFEKKSMLSWGADLSAINFQDITYFARATEKSLRDWKDVPSEISSTFDRLGIPQAERAFLAGVSAQFESEVVYHNLKGIWEKQGVLFTDMDTALREYPDVVREFFGTVIPAADNKFSALNTAVWSGGSFVYVPKGVHVEIPLQAYFRINAEKMGQFERTLIIAEEGSSVHYVEGCTAPTYSSNSLHSAVVEILVRPGAKVRYTTIQNWSKNVYNLVTKRAFVEAEGSMSWVDGNLGCLAEGSKVTTPDGMKSIEDLEVGERVLSYDDRSGELCFRPVRAKRFSGVQPVREVSIGGRRLWATANHPFFSYAHDAARPKKLGRYQLGFVRLDALTHVVYPRTSIAYGRPYSLLHPSLETSFVNANQHGAGYSATRSLASRLTAPHETNDELMWLFGYWVGDGNIDTRAGQTAGVVRYAKVGFSTPRKDRARSRVLQAMAAVIETTPQERSDGNHLAWSSKELAAFFEINGFYGDARSKRVPEWVWSLPESQRLAFIAGYLDADGCVTAGRRFFSLKSCNRALLEDVRSLLVTLGIDANLSTEFDAPREVEIMGVRCTATGAYRLDIRLDERLISYVSPTLRAKAQGIPRSSRVQHRIVGRSNILLPDAVEVARAHVGEATGVVAPTWDIEVEGTGTFIAEGFIVHNSQLTMKYPSVYLKGPKAHGEVLSIALANDGQHQDAGAKAVHLAPETTSQVTSKSISVGTGRSTYRGLVKIARGAKNARATVRCDALLLNAASRSDTHPSMQVDESSAIVEHEATVSRIGDEQRFYLQSRGLTEAQATALIVRGFVEPFVSALPMEYAVELNRLIDVEMEGAVG